MIHRGYIVEQTAASCAARRSPWGLVNVGYCRFAALAMLQTHRWQTAPHVGAKSLAALQMIGREGCSLTRCVALGWPRWRIASREPGRWLETHRHLISSRFTRPIEAFPPVFPERPDAACRKEKYGVYKGNIWADRTSGCGCRPVQPHFECPQSAQVTQPSTLRIA